MWYAKLKWGYEPESTEGTANILEINGILNGAGYTLQAQAGLLANVYSESGLNPWRWQYERVNYNAGYGLFQFTHASDYFNECSGLPGFAPSRSTTSTTPGALPSDGYCQVNVFVNDTLHKWSSDCWPYYWDKNVHAALWTQMQNIFNAYGDGSSLTQAQFARITDYRDATIAFLGGYERELDPSDYPQRVAVADRIYPILSGDTPVPPTPPGPTPFRRGKLPVWMMIKRIH